MQVHACEIAVGGGRGCDIGAGVESALNGACVETVADGVVDDRAAQRETYVAGATGAAECPVRCYYRRCLPCRGNASVETGMPFQTPGENPCARVVGDASVCGMSGWVRI